MTRNRTFAAVIIIAILIVAFYVLSVGFPAVHFENDVIGVETVESATALPPEPSQQGAIGYGAMTVVMGPGATGH